MSTRWSCIILCAFGIAVGIGCTDDGAADRKEAAIPTSPPWPPDPPAISTSEPGPADPDAPTEFTATDSGLKYRILRKSDGRQPQATDTVTVNYRGWLDDGQEFDSSYKRGEPTSFPLNGVIKGWTEGLQLVGEGGMIELEIPADLGYGSRGSPPKIKPGDTLHFIVELLIVK